MPDANAHWIRSYSTSALQSDTAAGLTTAVMLIPQAMAYALLAGLPPIMGLYASTIPLLIYALIGTSRQLSVGPIAMASLIVATVVGEIVGPEGLEDEGLVITTAILLTMLAGIVQIILAILRLGGLVNLLSHPVVTGFTSAAAIIIGTSQLQHVVGFHVPRGKSVIGTYAFLVEHLGQSHLLSISIGAVAILLLVLIRRLSPRWPAALTVVIIGIALSWAFGFEALGVKVLGEIPAGLPKPVLPVIDLEIVQKMAPMAITVALIGFMESISAARIYARQNRYAIRPGQELVALGFANIGSALFGGYTVGGALSRSAVNAQAGAVTPMANVVTASAIGVTLFALTPVFYFLPTPILAAIILVAVVGLLDFAEVVHLWKVKRDDLGLLIITFCATLFGSIEMGILVGVGASLLWMVYTTTRPEIRSLGRIPETRSYRCIDHFPLAETFDRILILRMDAQFFFGNIAYLKDILFKRLDAVPDALAVVLDASGMNGLDSSAADTLEELIRELRRQRIEIFISHVKGAVLQVMADTSLLDTLGEGHIYYEVDDAVRAALCHRTAVEQGLPPEAEEFGESDMLD